MHIPIKCLTFTLAFSSAILPIPAGFSHDCAAESRRKTNCAESPNPPSTYRPRFALPMFPNLIRTYLYTIDYYARRPKYRKASPDDVLIESKQKRGTKEPRMLKPEGFRGNPAGT